MNRFLWCLFFSVNFSTVFCQDKANYIDCKEYSNKGDSSFQKGQMDNSIYFYKNALKCFKLDGNELEQTKIAEKIGNVYVAIGSYSQAMVYFLKAQKLAEVIKNTELIIQINLSIASMKMDMGRFDDALEYLNKAKGFFKLKALNSRTNEIELFQLYGVSYGSKGKIDSALYYFEKCAELYLSSEKDENYGGILNNIGAIYSKKENNEKALEKYEEAILYFKEIKSEIGVGVTTGNIAYIHQKEGRFKEAIYLYNQAIAIFKKHNAYHYLSNNYMNLSDLYKSIGNYQEALEFHELYVLYDEKSKSAEEVALIESLEMRQAVGKKDQEIKIIEKDNQLKATQKNILITVLISLLLLSLLIYLNLRSSNQRTQLKKELAEKERGILQNEIQLKEKDLEILALKIIEKNKFLTDLKGNLNELEQGEGNFGKIKALEFDISNNLNLDKERLEFELQVDQLQKSFVLKLENIHPNLTKTEKRLCSLLLMELSSKDVATVMNITEESVKKNRNRLRKKLNLEAGQNIGSYLKNFG